MYVTVNLSSRKTGEIKCFLERFYQRELDMDEGVEQWIYIYKKPLEAIEMISTVIDNNDQHKIKVCVQVDRCDVHSVTYENYNDIIKALLYLYYKEEGLYEEST
ncbi:hypothetical protein RBH29_00970 [Herbivorax sp. ANBcel31]|uniref:hypothetical protein n=1 Tax=Herbivorax sp. ANBcel31 TaxID=3069754 RepID=UPI0027B52B1D|nr:hypothetical protein [Herbivorax sp. ANBcel31]MDQ2085009.1 hypothetical protein [Herbivorax sp. ANBcel31]